MVQSDILKLIDMFEIVSLVEESCSIADGEYVAVGDMRAGFRDDFRIKTTSTVLEIHFIES